MLTAYEIRKQEVTGNPPTVFLAEGSKIASIEWLLGHGNLGDTYQVVTLVPAPLLLTPEQQKWKKEQRDARSIEEQTELEKRTWTPLPIRDAWWVRLWHWFIQMNDPYRDEAPDGR